MKRVSQPEILDSDECPPKERARSLRDLDRINRWFGGVSTTCQMIERVAERTGQRHFTLLEVAAGTGEVPRISAEQLSRKGIETVSTLLDRLPSHLPAGDHGVAADALALPFPENSFDLVSCSLFAHHLEPPELKRFAAEALRVSRVAVLINDLIRSPIHLALVYAAFPLMRSYVSRVDGVRSVRRAYRPEEMRQIIADSDGLRMELSRKFLYRMAVILWKSFSAT